MKKKLLLYALSCTLSSIYAKNNTIDTCQVPTIITPNDDGKNDALVIECIPNSNNTSELSVFNEWGDRMFFAKPYYNNWEGTYNGRALPVGTYFYIFRQATDAEAISGSITIYR